MAHVYTIDCETDPFLYDRTPKPFVWGFSDGLNFRYFWGNDCCAQLVEFLLTIPAGTIYAHNGGKFDYFFLLEYLKPQISLINGRISKAFIGDHELRDSLNIIPVALKQFAKLEIDYKKLEVEVRDEHKDEIIEYLTVDCESLHAVVVEFIRNFGEHLTVAGAAFSYLQIHTDYGYVKKTSIDYDNKLRVFYSGGRVQCFKVGALGSGYSLYDINSAYPAAMIDQHWYGSRYKIQYKITSDLYRCGSWFAEIDAVSYGCLPFRAEKTFYPNDTETRRYFATGHEILAGLDTGTLKIIKIRYILVPYKLKSMSEYVEKFYKMKADCKKSGDKRGYIFAKLLQNSCYGKFGQDGRKFKDYLIAGTCDDEGFKIHSEVTRDLRIYEKDAPQDYFFNVAVAASITGSVRAKLWCTICNSEDVVYCDTDSIICKKFGGEIDSVKLGAWNLECDIDELYIASKKMYTLKSSDGKTKTASKGVKLSHDEIRDHVISETNIETKREAPTFSLKFGSRFISREINFENISQNTCTVPENAVKIKLRSRKDTTIKKGFDFFFK